jgi:hypothetical protein
MTDQHADDVAAEGALVRALGRDCFASTCPYCKCKGFHSEFCAGFEINDPARHIGGCQPQENEA